MALIYITDETREKMDSLCETEQRSISNEVSFLVNRRTDELKLEKERLESSSLQEASNK